MTSSNSTLSNSATSSNPSSPNLISSTGSSSNSIKSGLNKTILPATTLFELNLEVNILHASTSSGTANLYMIGIR